MQKTINIKNKKSEYQYYLYDEFSAGIQLTGTEIKSIRLGKASIGEAYCQLKEGELFVINMHIAEYSHGTYSNHEPKRDRKLLLTARELKKITSKITEKGFTIIPTLLFINENGLAKLNIAIAKGKNYHDKRETIKDKDIKRDMDRMRF
jgi:SsrA-binding protein